MFIRIARFGGPAVCATFSVLGTASHAQVTQPSASASTLPPVVVTGNPLRSSTVTTPVSSLAGEGLVLRRAATLGETLDGLPGVSSSYFGPNASRPIIRGQDGDRIRLLSNAGASLDASGLSADHAVPIDPLVVERIEVLRGPAALLYGGSAVGGVVNAIDNRIPKHPIDALTGTAEARVGGAARERGAGAVVEAGADGLALHVDGFWRETDDLHVPRFDRPVDAGSERRSRIVNSASQGDGGAVGGSLVWDRGHVGAAFDTYRNDYGTVAEEEVTIRMRRDKLAWSGEVRDLPGPIRTVRGLVQTSDYEHQELEAGAVGTTFENRGTDSRFEFEHAALTLPFGAMRGVFGAQTDVSRFSALGEEAFVPGTRTRQAAAFVFEELDWGEGRMNVGARLERTRVRSAGDAAGESRFGPEQTRRFDTASAAVGGSLDLDDEWQLSANLAYTERAPTFYELYANGVHVATATFERGDAALRKEKGSNIDLAVQWKRGAHRARAGIYAGRYSNYIALLATGEPDAVNDEGEAFPVHAFSGVAAKLWGVELEGAWRAPVSGRRVDLDAKLDLARAVNRDTGEPLPRVPPVRITLGTNWGAGSWNARAEVVHASRQSRVPADDASTDGHTLLNASASYALNMGAADGLLFAKLMNIGDTLAYNASGASSVRYLAPLPGRSLMLGLRIGF